MRGGGGGGIKENACREHLQFGPTTNWLEKNADGVNVTDIMCM